MEPAPAQFFLSIILFSLVGLLHLLPNPLPHPLLLEEPPAELEGFLFVSPLKRYPRVLGIPGSGVSKKRHTAFPFLLPAEGMGSREGNVTPI